MSRLVILYGIGGLSDVGRHAVRAALDNSNVAKICVLTQHPELLELPNWKCSCPDPHTFTDEERKRFEVVPVKEWNDQGLTAHFKDATAVISCLGNRQPGLFEPELKKGWVSHAGNKLVVEAVQEHNIKRVVVMSSVGVAEGESILQLISISYFPCSFDTKFTQLIPKIDWPCLEFFTMGRIILGALFVIPGLARRAYKDLSKADELYRATDEASIDYLLVRPVGLGDEVVPVGTWQLQKKKYVDTVGMNMAKLDCARFMLQEALEPTLHRKAVVIGSVEETKTSTEQN